MPFRSEFKSDFKSQKKSMTMKLNDIVVDEMKAMDEIQLSKSFLITVINPFPQSFHLNQHDHIPRKRNIIKIGSC